MTYKEICQKLDMNPDIQFVKVEDDGTIGFTSGKPDEIRLLLKRIRETGMRPSEALLTTVRGIDPYNYFLHQETNWKTS